MSLSEIAIRLAVAALCGGVIGFEREHQRKPAGLRTHMLVAIGSAAFTLAMLHIDQAETTNGDAAQVQVDLSRIIQGVAGGIGFLGAGAIMRSQGSVHGLTTAATIWVVGAVGISCGLGDYLLAASTSVLVVLIASILGMFENWLFSHLPPPKSEDSSGPTSQSAQTDENANEDIQNSSKNAAN